MNKVLGILEPEEAQDVTTINLDQLFVRFSNIAGSEYTPESLNTYKSRLRSAIDDFTNYQENPMAFRPGVVSRARKSSEKSKSAGQDNGDAAFPKRGNSSVPPAASVSILPIPIRPDLTIQIQGLPYDLTPAEANKIANVIRAMASTE